MVYSKVSWLSALSTLVFVILFPLNALAHEVMPAIADMEERDGRLQFKVETNLEGILAGIDLSTVTDTNEAPEAKLYDQLRALSPEALAEELEREWSQIADKITIRVGDLDLLPVLNDVKVDSISDESVPRLSALYFSVDLPNFAQTVQFGWASELGGIVIRQMGVEKPYDAYLGGGEISPPIQLSGGDQMSAVSAFGYYIPVGYEHIVPLGLDHILFVLGLFFLSARLRPLLWQVSAFTVAHTVTLALAALGYVQVPATIVEPLIAASIVFVAVENIAHQGLSKWRPLVVFAFGLLHGLGFASVLGDYGLPAGNFVPALIGFNVGVELGQLSVILAAFAIVGFWFGSKNWYRRVIAVPASVGIAMVGAFWFLERTLL